MNGTRGHTSFPIGPGDPGSILHHGLATEILHTQLIDQSSGTTGNTTDDTTVTTTLNSNQSKKVSFRIKKENINVDQSEIINPNQTWGELLRPPIPCS